MKTIYPLFILANVANLANVAHSAHLTKGPLSVYELVEHKDWYEGEGDGGQEPAQNVGPQWINISAAELQGRVSNDGEDEGALR